MTTSDRGTKLGAEYLALTYRCCNDSDAYSGTCSPQRRCAGLLKVLAPTSGASDLCNFKLLSHGFKDLALYGSNAGDATFIIECDTWRGCKTVGCGFWGSAGFLPLGEPCGDSYLFANLSTLHLSIYITLILNQRGDLTVAEKVVLYLPLPFLSLVARNGFSRSNRPLARHQVRLLFLYLLVVISPQLQFHTS